MSTFYIATTGNDTTGNGSESTPWATLTKANASSANGDTIILQDGTYTWSSLGPMSSLRIYQAETVGGAILDGAGGHISYSAGSLLGDINVVGIVFQNMISTSSAPAISPVSTYYTHFTNCVFRNMSVWSGFAAYLLDENKRWSLSSCLIYGIDTSTDGNNKVLFGVTNTGAIYNIENCTIIFSGAGVYKLNAIFRQGSASPGPTVNFINNIVYNSQGITVNWERSGATLTGTKNVQNSCHYLITGVPAGVDNITSDPLFVDASSDNFALRPTSPCISAGTLL